MADVDEPRSVQESLQEITDLLRRQRVVESLAHREGEGRSGSLTDRQPLVDSLVHKQNEAELQSRLDALHPADVALILEALPLDDRLRVWQLVKADRDGEILLEVSDAVRETLIADMDRGELVAATDACIEEVPLRTATAQACSASFQLQEQQPLLVCLVLQVQ
jgi:magnesium transporter